MARGTRALLDIRGETLVATRLLFVFDRAAKHALRRKRLALRRVSEPEIEEATAQPVT